MSRKTEFLKLHLPDGDDVYDVEIDQNQNFQKIDAKLKEWDKGKEPTINKKTGFNLDKTDNPENNINKLFTAKGAFNLDKEKLNVSEAWKNHYKIIGSSTTTTDLNSIVEIGEYANQQNINKFTNSPVTNKAFILSVQSISPNSDNYKTQVLSVYNSQEIYKRIKNDNSWSAWWRIDGGDRLSLNGGRVRGNIEANRFIQNTRDSDSNWSVQSIFVHGGHWVTEFHNKPFEGSGNKRFNIYCSSGDTYDSQNVSILRFPDISNEEIAAYQSWVNLQVDNAIKTIVGKNYGGFLNTSELKTAGLTYYDKNTKKLFLCKKNNSDMSANANNYIPLDNNSLLDRLDNLLSFHSHGENISSFKIGEVTIVYGSFKDVERNTVTHINLPYTFPEGRIVLASLWHSKTAEVYSIHSDIVEDKLEIIITGGSRRTFSGYFFIIGKERL